MSLIHGSNLFHETLFEPDSSKPDDENDSRAIEEEWICYKKKCNPLIAKHTITANFGNSGNPKEKKIKASLSKSEAVRIVELLKKYQDIFA